MPALDQMQAGIRNAEGLFLQPIRYLVPIYQRPYVWNEEDQWEPLWEDIASVAEAELEVRQSSISTVESHHFLGALVLQQQPNKTGHLQTRLVIDGQQRLTTLQLVIDAAEHVMAQMGNRVESTAGRLSDLVLNDERRRSKEDPDSRFKLRPTLTDQEAFRAAMDNEADPANIDSSTILDAHDYFKSRIRDWITADGPSGILDRAEALEAALTHSLRFVVIDLGANDNPNLIFETLNARGTPLLAWDLVKNYAIYEEESRASGASETMYHNHITKLESDWWRAEVRQGRLTRSRIEIYLNYWLVARTHQEVQSEDVFPAFQEYSRERVVSDVISDLSESSRAYATISDLDDDSPLGVFLRRWRVMQLGLVTPVLLWLLTNEVPDTSLNRSIRALESFFVRRMVTRSAAKNLNMLFISLLARLESRGDTPVDEVILSFLRSQSAPSRTWPTDGEFREELEGARLYKLISRGRLRMVLEAIEESMRTSMSEQLEIPNKLTIEHLFPQNWANHWPQPIRSPRPSEQPHEYRERLIHSIGNLTLVTKKLNPSLGNGPWPAKKAKLQEHSQLFLNKDLLANAGDTWTDADIIARGKRLADLAIEIWPPPEKI